MSGQPDKFDWLPESLEPVALRLARADALAFRIGEIASKWSLDGPLGFEQVRSGGEVQMVVKSLRPVPPEASLLFSEGVNHLRAAVDNVIWYLVEQEQGDIGDSAAASRVNMPIVESEDALKKWTASRSKIVPLASDTSLGRRIRALQPFVDEKSAVPSMSEGLAAIIRVDVEFAHPLRLLQAYSNADKHRSIRLAAGRTFTSTDASPMAEQDLAPRELKVGDPLGPPRPWGQLAIVETNTAIMVQRPAPFSSWVNPVRDLNAMRRHISQVVVPMLLTGLEMSRSLPPAIDLDDSGKSNRELLEEGRWEDAEARLQPLISQRFWEAEDMGVQFIPVVDKD